MTPLKTTAWEANTLHANGNVLIMQFSSKTSRDWGEGENRTFFFLFCAHS